jgi:D-tyrosyl-tRNA(Tyr) deacylase
VRIVLQRIASAAVEVDGEVVARVGFGLLLFVAVVRGDGQEQIKRAAKKVAELRVFDDEKGRMQFDCFEAGGEILLVSQFTLAASLGKGRRPSFDRAADPALARPLIEGLVKDLRSRGLKVRTGRFGATMSVSLVNDGPVTFVIEVD